MEHNIWLRKKNICPIEILCVIIDRKLEKETEEVLKKHEVSQYVTFLGEGTSAQSALGDLFGFGISEKSVLVGLIDVAKSRLALEDLREEIGYYKDGRGLAMTLPLSSATSTMLDMLNIEY